MQQNNKVLGDRAILDILALSGDATAIYTGQNLIIEMANDAMLASWGKGREIIGLPLYDAVPELRGQPFNHMLQQVLTTGKTDVGIIKGETRIDGELQTHHYQYEYRAIKDRTGRPYAVLHRAVNVSEQEIRKRYLEAREQEIQQLNEELAVSNEVLRTTNEELVAVNEELQTSNDYVSELNDDLVERGRRLQLMYASLAETEERFRELVWQAPVAIFVAKARQKCSRLSMISC